MLLRIAQPASSANPTPAQVIKPITHSASDPEAVPDTPTMDECCSAAALFCSDQIALAPNTPTTAAMTQNPIMTRRTKLTSRIHSTAVPLFFYQVERRAGVDACLHLTALSVAHEPAEAY
jgi:hypothetical protein